MKRVFLVGMLLIFGLLSSGNLTARQSDPEDCDWRTLDGKPCSMGTPGCWCFPQNQSLLRKGSNGR